ncbi:MAG: hypothetical protein DI640_02715 [Sphingomonas taxi]|uniref:Uncharacterized protein n=1 Tax=Sphingomonas taxi TaxID=1549858 RepID=A0A2W5AZH9_9SPHN|nr:MAG: hypothetical protein DI640_02715 [Sphingomonas taxi]
MRDVANEAIRAITTTFPTGPRPSPGWLQRSGQASLFSREGGSPVWIPAFAGKHASLVQGERGMRAVDTLTS